jgi:hypothetical protein
MKSIFSLSILLILCTLYGETANAQLTMGVTVEKSEKVLRHVVLFNFIDSATEADIKEIEDAFSALPSKIPEIIDFEWGLNNSPENLDKGFTHCYFITFANEEGRDIYLPHPDHVAFTEIVGPHLEDVLVVDYWSK